MSKSIKTKTSGYIEFNPGGNTPTIADYEEFFTEARVAGAADDSGVKTSTDYSYEEFGRREWSILKIDLPTSLDLYRSNQQLTVGDVLMVFGKVFGANFGRILLFMVAFAFGAIIF